MRLLRAVLTADVPPGLGTLTQVETLRQVWIQHFPLVEGQVGRRDPEDRPPGGTRLVTPSDSEARGSVERDTLWDGFKVHLTETCEPDTPNLVTNVATTVATVHGSVTVPEIHDAPAMRDCLPGEHWVDARYPTAGRVVTARREHGILLHGPMATSTAASADGPFGQDAFTTDRDRERVTCPNGATSTQWRHRHSQQCLPVIRVRFSPADCHRCPHLRECVNSPQPNVAP